MVTRYINGAGTEIFNYDDHDRLVKYSINGVEKENYAYSANGNLTSKTYVGTYSYEGAQPHAVTKITNSNGNVPVTSGDMEFTYDETGNISMIEDYANVRGTSFFTGPDLQRWVGGDFLYFGDYEERYDNVSYTYLDGGVLCITRPSTGNAFYYIHTDNLGSIIEIVDASGQTVFRASYDPWGLQTVTTNSINFHRGYTGHEMLNNFGLIHMNGRLYDPINARFLSPDNYVQEPTNSQNFNRYSYCLNNPMKFTDPSGEIFELTAILTATFAVGNTMVHAIRGDIHHHGFWNNFKSAAFYFGQGALAGAAIGAIAEFAPMIPVVGTAIDKAISAYKIVQGSSAILGALSTLTNTGKGEGMWNGLKTFLGNFYIDENADFFEGVWQGVSRHTWEFPQTAFGNVFTQFRNLFRSVDRVDYMGGATFATTYVSFDKYKGSTLGNFINVWNDDKIKGEFDEYVISHPLYMHEYGHYLDSQKLGLSYLPWVGSFSFVDSWLFHSSVYNISRTKHRSIYVERRANKLAKKYFNRNYGVDWNTIYQDGKYSGPIEKGYPTW